MKKNIDFGTFVYAIVTAYSSKGKLATSEQQFKYFSPFVEDQEFKVWERIAKEHKLPLCNKPVKVGKYLKAIEIKERTTVGKTN